MGELPPIASLPSEMNVIILLLYRALLVLQKLDIKNMSVEVDQQFTQKFLMASLKCM